MKTILKIILITVIFNASAQNIGINETGELPDNSALLDLKSVDKGFLITRVDTANIVSPAFGLMTLAPIDSCLYMSNEATNGKVWTIIGGVGINCTCTSPTPALDFPCDGTVIPVVDVTNPTTGKTWMDRNLGASQVATSSTDTDAYGDLYQWGRCSDGHEKINSGITNTKSTTDTPGHGDFITSASDWRNPKNDNLWQGVTGINNPCPTGYRIPTEAELLAERNSWTSADASGALNSPLKLPLSGRRIESSGALQDVDTKAYYWSSTVTGNNSKYLYFDNSNSTITGYYRAFGFSVRCIKN